MMRPSLKSSCSCGKGGKQKPPMGRMEPGFLLLSPPQCSTPHNVCGFGAAQHSQVHGLWCLASRVPSHGQPGAVAPALPALYIMLGTLHKHLFARSEAVIICLYSRDAFFHSSVNLLRLNMEKKGVTGSFQDFIAFFNVWPPRPH